MALTPEQRAMLETLGPELVRQKLLEGGGVGRGAALRGFETAPGTYLLRGDVEDWLAEKHRENLHVQHSTLQWAKIAAWAGIAGVITGAVAIAVAIWLAK